MENFLRRLSIYTKVKSNPAMTEIVVKILVELLATLALATQQVKQGKLSGFISSLMLCYSLRRVLVKFGKKLLGERDVEALLQRVDRLTQEESRTAASVILETVHDLAKSMRVVIESEPGPSNPRSVIC